MGEIRHSPKIAHDPSPSVTSCLSLCASVIQRPEAPGNRRRTGGESSFSRMVVDLRGSAKRAAGKMSTGTGRGYFRRPWAPGGLCISLTPERLSQSLDGLHHVITVPSGGLRKRLRPFCDGCRVLPAFVLPREPHHAASLRRSLSDRGGKKPRAPRGENPGARGGWSMAAPHRGECQEFPPRPLRQRVPLPAGPVYRSARAVPPP